LEVGDFVLAIGNPLEFNNSVSEGIVSAKHRVIKKAPIEDLIQPTAMINPGNSGGALVDLDGKLVGINMAIATNSGMWSGLGFAIPSKNASSVANQIIQGGKVARGYLGIEMERLTNSLAHQLGYDKNIGIVVSKVRPGTAADRAGLQQYDIVAKVNGKEIKEINDMHRNIAARNVGEEVELEVYRDEGNKQLAQKVVKVLLDERPTEKELGGTTLPEPKLPGDRPAPDALFGMKVSPAPGGKGVVVDEVTPASKAAHAGIQKGDVIFQVNKQNVSSEQDMQKAIRSSDTPDEPLLYIERKGRSALVTITAQ
jgi:serine protease Do